MIRVDAPGAALATLNLFFTDGTLRAHYHTSFFGPGLGVAGFVVEYDEPDENWPAVKASIASLASTLGVTRLRVHFDDYDPSALEDRLAPRSFFVTSAGGQSER